MAIFERAFAMFTPFSKVEGNPGEEHGTQQKAETSGATTSAEIAELKSQLSEMQAQLDRLSTAAPSEKSDA